MLLPKMHPFFALFLVGGQNYMNGSLLAFCAQVLGHCKVTWGVSYQNHQGQTRDSRRCIPKGISQYPAERKTVHPPNLKGQPSKKNLWKLSCSGAIKRTSKTTSGGGGLEGEASWPGTAACGVTNNIMRTLGHIICGHRTTPAKHTAYHCWHIVT